MGTLFEKVAGVFERRFLLNFLLPGFCFSAALLVVIVVGRGTAAAVLKGWSEQAVSVQLLECIAFLVWTIFLASALASRLISLTRFFEGYWTFPLGQWLRERGTAWHRARFVKLGQMQGGYQRIYGAYAMDSSAIMPTRFGNILKEAEVYPTLRYGLSSVLIWPRLYGVLPERAVATLAEARAALDFSIVVAGLAGLFSILSGLYLLVIGADWWLFLLCFWGGLAVAWFAYTTALESAMLFGEQVKVTVDLYRLEVLTKMRLPAPRTPAEEEAWWREVDVFLYRGHRESPEAWRYTVQPESLTEPPA